MRILVAVDGSDNALKAVQYASNMSHFKVMEIVLFNVHSKVPEYYWDAVWVVN